MKVSEYKALNKPNKFRNQKAIIGNEKFDSMKEANRWLVLKDMEKQGEITKLERQVPFILIPSQKGKYRNERETKYIADFTYYQNGELIVEDTKGMKTKEYIIKRKLMQYILNIEVKEV